MSWCSRIGSKPPPFFFLPFLGRATLVVRRRLGSSACSPGGRLLSAMISSIVFLTDPPFFCGFFEFALAFAFAFGAGSVDDAAVS